MEEILKELQGKNMTKNKLFEFLSTAIGTGTTAGTGTGTGTGTTATTKIKPKKQ